MMQPFGVFEIRPLDHSYHAGEGGFREQMSVLYLAGETDDGYIKLIRSFVALGTSGMSGFDANMPGVDTAEGWQRLDSLIENSGVRGTFHTHPPGGHHFSPKDWESMDALAKANGPRYIFHGVQSVDAQTAHFVCMHMIRHQVLCYDYGWHVSDINDPVLLLPAPPSVSVDGRGIAVMSWDQSEESP